MRLESCSSLFPPWAGVIMKEIFERIKGDFFSVMAPGFHVLVVFLILGISLAWKDPVAIDIHEVFSPTKEIYSYWPNFIIATFLAYLFGHFLRFELG